MTAVALLAGAMVVVLLVGPRMARVADNLAEATGSGGALFGVVFLALATDLPEIALTPTAVITGTPRIAVGGLLGSTAAQLTLIAVVDIAFRQGKLVSRVSTTTTLGQCALMMAVLAVPLVMAAGGPTVGGIGIGTLLLPLTYLGLLAAIRGIEPDEESTLPSAADATEEPGTEPEESSTAALWKRFVLYAVLLAGAGVALESAAETIGSSLGLGETVAGALLAGVVTPRPSS